MTTAQMPCNPSYELGKDALAYLRTFPYHIDIQAGHVYDAQFKEFNEWCNNTLGVKYRDWYMLGSGKRNYRLHLRDTKYSMFLTLKYSDIIVSSNLL